MASLKQHLKNSVSALGIENSFLIKRIRNYRLHNHYMKLAQLDDLDEETRKMWDERTRKVKLSSDNANIVKVADAGRLIDGKLVMHNGLVIDPMSYYGAPVLRMLMQNKAVHEPQEEYVFQEVLKTIKPGSTMLELGCYWAFYSMWFAKKIPGAKNYVLDGTDGIQRAKQNFRMNNLQCNYIDGLIGKEDLSSEINFTNVDRICKEHNIRFLDILHSDIQGYELEMLHTMPELVARRGIGYIFISTHSEELHRDCIKWLGDNGYIVLCNANLKETFSEDGLIVARDPSYPGLDKIIISSLVDAKAV